METKFGKDKNMKVIVLAAGSRAGLELFKVFLMVTVKYYNCQE